MQQSIMNDVVEAMLAERRREAARQRRIGGARRVAAARRRVPEWRVRVGGWLVAAGSTIGGSAALRPAVRAATSRTTVVRGASGSC
jgi:hypothetical protein